jgi:pimeloyl-ACP methyl ester carboxylesterase
MLMNQVLILHGWSDDSESFEPLAEALKSQGFEAIPIWLGDYVSRDDDVTISDVAKRMEEVLASSIQSKKLNAPFDMIVHSTGGLVARQWVTSFDARRGSRWLQRLVMLAPANYGSRLASIGKSMLGRLVKGFDNGFHTGTQMLNALELGSPFQWQLSLADVLQDPMLPATSIVPYGPGGCLPFVITGIKGYDSILRRPLNEDGADGTVRASAANLTSHGLTLDFSNIDAQPTANIWQRIGPIETFAFRALDDVDHGSIIARKSSAIALVLQALRCQMDLIEYSAIQKEWWEATEKLASDKEERHQFFQLNSFVVDDLGQPVGDHFLEFFASTGKKRDAALSVFQSEVIKHVHVNQVNAACRNFYLDRTDLVTKFYAAQEAGKPSELWLSISASPPGPNITYFKAQEQGASGEYRIHLADDTQAGDRWLRRHCTHFLKIIIPRRPLRDVFKMRRA